MSDVPLLTIVDTITDLKALVPGVTPRVLLVGKSSVGDSLGGFYRWDSSDNTTVEDTTFMNVIPSSVTGVTGRWKRIFQKASIYPQGKLVTNGGVKTFFLSGTTDANGEIIIYLTDDGTATGNPIFTEIWSVIPQPQVNANGPAEAVQSYRKSMAANLKSTAYGFYKANAVTVTVGLLLVPVASIGAGTVVQFRVEGI